MAARGGDAGAIGDQGTEHPPAPPGVHGAAAPQTGEVRAGVQLQAGGGDRLAVGRGEHRRDLAGRARELLAEAAAEVRTVRAEGAFVDLGDQVDAGRVGDRDQCDAFGQYGGPGQPSGLGDHQGLLLPGGEAGREQAPGEIGGAVVPVRLPLEGESEGVVVADLFGDDPVRVGLVDAGPENAVPGVCGPGLTHDGPVALDAAAGPVGARPPT